MSAVRDFYSGKNVFITGATGFVGVCLLEKILRTIPDHGEIYILMRPKRDKDIETRFAELKKTSVFETFPKENSEEDLFKKVHPVSGDVSEENLGLSVTDRQTLVENVNVIFHSAATLDFGDTLKSTIDINLLGTRRVTDLAKECKNLNVLVHVSSAYVNAYMLNPEEVLYPLPKDPEDLIKLASELTPKELEDETPNILGDHPNPYTLTKHMAEHEIKKCEALFPCAIVRPSMIVGSWKEPTPGWTISKNGPQGFIMGAAKGVIRRLPVAKRLIYDYIPVDIVVNELIVAGFHAGSTGTKELEIYHCTSSTRNPFKWANVENSINLYLHKFPLMSSVWYPSLKFSDSMMSYKISAFFVHILPAFFLDNLSRLCGARPILMKLHRNVNTSLGRLQKFIFTEWFFSANNSEKLHKFLQGKDRQDFGVDISSLAWPVYFDDLTFGSRVYLSKEPKKTLEKARKRDNLLFYGHMILKCFVVLFIWTVFSKLLGIGMTQTMMFLVPAGIAFLAFI